MDSRCCTSVSILDSESETPVILGAQATLALGRGSGASQGIKMAPHVKSDRLNDEYDIDLAFDELAVGRIVWNKRALCPGEARLRGMAFDEVALSVRSARCTGYDQR